MTATTTGSSPAVPRRARALVEGVARFSGVVALGMLAVLLAGALIVNLSLVWLLPVAGWAANLIR
ncbi:hypothetical protein ACWKWP_12445 [Agromyces soli]